MKSKIQEYLDAGHSLDCILDTEIDPYVYDLAVKGIVPPNPETRRKLGLPRVMPSERNLRARHEPVRIGSEGWERVYFKKVGK